MNKVNHYTDEFKIRIVEEVLSGKITKEECRRQYGIKGKSTVLKWIRKFAGTYTRFPSMNIEQKSEEIDRLREQLRLLKKELEYEQLKSTSYLEMIKIAEEDLKFLLEKSLVPNSPESKRPYPRVQLEVLCGLFGNSRQALHKKAKKHLQACG
ncbi:MAG: transposase [Saprospiraceae bacterium]|nr:transposase [Saprospiraceae bacterium]